MDWYLSDHHGTLPDKSEDEPVGYSISRTLKKTSHQVQNDADLPVEDGI